MKSVPSLYFKLTQTPSDLQGAFFIGMRSQMETIQINDKLKSQLGIAIFETLHKAMSHDESILRMAGQAVALTSTPVFLQVAVLLRDNFCSAGDAWADVFEIRALVDFSIGALQRDVEETRKHENPDDESYIEEIDTLRKDLINWKIEHVKNA